MAYHRNHTGKAKLYEQQDRGKVAADRFGGADRSHNTVRRIGRTAGPCDANLAAEDTAGARVYALVTVRLQQGRTISAEDYSLNALGGVYRCIAIREENGAFNANNWHIANASPKKKYGLLFALQIPAGQNYNNVTFDLVCNAPGKWNRTAIPFTDRRNQGFSAASAIPHGGRFPAAK